MTNLKSRKQVLISLTFVVISCYLAFKIMTISNTNSKSSTLGASVSSADGRQIIELKAKAGYSPASIAASANKDTILRVLTESTFDCSSALVIPKLGIRRNLPPTGTTDISLGSQTEGTILDGTCAMGMYRFKLSFN